MSDALLPPNATPMETAVGQTTARISGMPVPVRSVMDPESCPASLLPWLAWAMSVDEWDDQWPDEVKRSVIASSFEVHVRKGTIGAVKRLLSATGAYTEVVEWWQEPNDAAPHTFKINVLPKALGDDSDPSEPYLGLAAAEKTQRLINSTKPVRAQYQIALGAPYANALTPSAAMRRPLAVQSASATGIVEKTLNSPVSLDPVAGMARPVTLISYRGFA